MQNNLIFPWQEPAWHQLGAMRAALPHALLFHGMPGIGKAHLAEHFAKSLLCERPQKGGGACGECASCGWFAQYSHPDYRRVCPEALEADGAAEAEQDGEGAESGKASKSAKAPSKEIKIDQIRALADFMNISTHRQGSRVVTLFPAEALNAAAANALLKTLEEPPPATVFLLVTNAIDRLLPTILSRCRKFAVPMPSREAALAWMRQQGIAQAEARLDEHGGAPLAAAAAAQSELQETKDDFLRRLARPDAESALAIAERFQKLPPAELVLWLQRWLHDALALKLAGQVRYYPGSREQLAAMIGRTSARKLLAGLKSLNERRRIAEHPLSARLFIEDMMLEYSTLFTDKAGHG